MPDLTATIKGLCEFECGSGRIAAWVTLKQRMTDITGEFSIQMLASGKGSNYSTRSLLPRRHPWPNPSLHSPGGQQENKALLNILVRVDGGNDAENDGTYHECKEDNNEEWWGAVCSP